MKKKMMMRAHDEVKSKENRNPHHRLLVQLMQSPFSWRFMHLFSSCCFTWTEFKRHFSAGQLSGDCEQKRRLEVKDLCDGMRAGDAAHDTQA
jgi:hypothetical protein